MNTKLKIADRSQKVGRINIAEKLKMTAKNAEKKPSNQQNRSRRW